MQPLYLSAVEYMKRREFDLYVPAFYHPHMSKDAIYLSQQERQRPNPHRRVCVSNFRPTPFGHVDDPNRMQMAKYSTEVMVEMFQKKIRFQLVSDKDIPEVFDGIDRYLISLEHDVAAGVEHIVSYARLVVALREEIYKLYFRFMKENPTVLETLYPNNNPNKNLLSILAGLNPNQDKLKDLDPLQAKAFPPYDIDKTIPKVQEAVSADPSSMDVAYGLSNAVYDPGSDDAFNLNNFLSGTQ